MWHSGFSFVFKHSSFENLWSHINLLEYLIPAPATTRPLQKPSHGDIFSQGLDEQLSTSNAATRLLPWTRPSKYIPADADTNWFLRTVESTVLILWLSGRWRIGRMESLFTLMMVMMKMPLTTVMMMIPRWRIVPMESLFTLTGSTSPELGLSTGFHSSANSNTNTKKQFWMRLPLHFYTFLMIIA